MIISAIAAYSENKVIGVNNDLPWHIPLEFKHFKDTTTGHHILMGRKSLESLPSILPNRPHLIVSRNKAIFEHKDVHWFTSIQTAVDFAQEQGEQELFICGGAQIYTQCMDICDYLYLTEVHTVIEHGEAFFPEVTKDQWEVIEEKNHPALSKSKHAWTFRKFKRK